jgi:Matrixin
VRHTLVAAVAAVITVVVTSGEARAFCRERTCDPNDLKQQCEFNDNCVISGHLLQWRNSCVSFDAQEDGSPRYGIDASTVTEVAGRAFAPWLVADCGGGAGPSMKVGTFGPVECDEVSDSRRSNEKGANVIMFRDDVWPYTGAIDAYALTTVNFDTDTGEIIDADIEVNSAGVFQISVDGTTGTDLQSILTHEAGHFLGMAHAATDDHTATMRANWDGVGTDLRTLTSDDEAGICDAYPPTRQAASDCEPLNGFASACHVPADEPSGGGCALVPARPAGDSAPSALLGVCALVVARTIRRRKRA